MNAFLKIDLSVFSIVLLLLLILSNSGVDEKHVLTNRLYLGMVSVSMLMLSLDAVGWALEGIVDPTLNNVKHLTNTLGFMAAPIPTFFFFLYAHNQVLSDDDATKRLGYLVALPLVPYQLLAGSAPFHGLMYTIDDQGFFHRGPLFMTMAILMFGYILAAFAFLGLYRHQAGPRRLYPLILFLLPPVFGAVVQLYSYGLVLVWPSMAISMLILQLYLQNRSLRTDYLTGLFNRRQLDHHLHARIQTWKPGVNMGALMLDIDNFKSINDSYGHEVGDHALTDMATILRKNFHHNDFVARYAGDEFVVVLQASKPEDFQGIIARLKETLEQFNRSGSRPFSLDFSIGYAVYDGHSEWTADRFLSHIDMLMYQDKRKKKLSTQSMAVAQQSY